MEKYKEELLNKLRSHIDFVRAKIHEKLESMKTLAERSLKTSKNHMFIEDKWTEVNSIDNSRNRLAELARLEGSPYFTKCEVVKENGEEKSYFFSKHQFSEESIYSWVAPVAAIRFEDVGQASYFLPDGTKKMLTIKRKEQYMIVNGKVVFFAVEEKDKPRELIYQEHFTRKKSEFVLPEIVAQIEKAQDQVIRANHKGPLIISGPAGSGKTTLALHRVAYLTQAPETATLYPPRSIIVFVQDMGTKKYFSTLLPELDINDVSITTFSEWAMSALGLAGYQYVERYGRDEEEKDLYEYQKLRALRENISFGWGTDIFRVLGSVYKKYFSTESLDLFNEQKKLKSLDRFDLVILLKAFFAKYKKYEVRREYRTFVNYKLVNKIERTPLSYSFMVVDEFQNYLPEQLEILNSCLNEETKSSVYVGDLSQQVKLGTIKNLEFIGKVLEPERNIRLNKVYRNTKSILSFIQSIGYKIEIPFGIKDGPEVVEKNTDNAEEEIFHINKFIKKYEHGSIGILSKSESYLEPFRKEFEGVKNIHVFSMLESQGVEFDIVFIVGVDREAMQVKQNTNVLAEHLEERRRMQKDLVYVALTRAITELHILGKDKLKDCFDWVRLSHTNI